MAATKTRRRLSAKQRRMAELMALGHTAVYAYKEAGYIGEPESCAHKIAENSRFQEYLTSILKKSETKAVKTRAQRLEYLSDVMDDTKDDDPRTGIAACDQLNKMTGEYAPERYQAKVEFTPVQELMQSLRLTGKIGDDRPQPADEDE